MPHVLLIDDRAEDYARLLRKLEDRGFELSSIDFAEPTRVLNKIATVRPDVVLLDRMFPNDDQRPQSSGKALFDVLREARPELPIVVFTDTFANDALPLEDFGTAPAFDKAPLLDADAGGRAAAVAELAAILQRTIEASAGETAPESGGVAVASEISAAMRYVREACRAAARTPLPVLITGEPGTELLEVAGQIHEFGGRAGALVIQPSARCEPHELEPVRADSAWSRAAGGTLALVDVEMLPAAALSSLRERLHEVMEGPGGEAPQLIATTHRSLDELSVADGMPYDVLSVLRQHVVVVPPLRDRPADIPRLARRALEQAAAAQGRTFSRTIRSEVLELLSAHRWPGNVTELNAVLASAVAATPGNVLLRESISLGPDLPRHEPEDPTISPSEPVLTEDMLVRVEVRLAADRIWSLPQEERWSEFKRASRDDVRRALLQAELFSRLEQQLGRATLMKDLETFFHPTQPTTVRKFLSAPRKAR